jgi:uncharacterized radical SAM superfamily Fe-S cluster-containing enzyme
MEKLLGNTYSLCSICLSKVPARKISDGKNIYLEKTCPEHGSQRVLIWRGAETYQEWGDFGEEIGGPRERLTETIKGCPYDCGLCPTHKAATCIAIMEVTSRCNLRCPVCFANSNETDNGNDFSVIKGMFETLFNAVGPCPIQLSGGEPTVRDDLPQIAELGQQIGFQHIMVNTNGIRIAEDIGYLVNLKHSGVDTIYLQFDGVTNDIYSQIRNKALLETKLQTLRNCAKIEMGVVLVPTLVPGINDHQIGAMIQVAKRWMPTVKGVHFQPVSYFGRYLKEPKDEDRLTIPDVLKAIEDQTREEIKRQNFVPRKRRESYCSFAGLFVLMNDGKLFATTNFGSAQSVIGGFGHFVEPPDKHVWQFLKTHWRFIPPQNKPVKSPKAGSLQELFERARTHCLSISCMPFQDVWNIDLERLQRCCTHVITPDRRLVPLCVYYITDTSGHRLYQRIEMVNYVS